MESMKSTVEKISSSAAAAAATSPTMLGPGFRFHPTDEELVRYYLKRKIRGKPLRFDAISQIDIYKSEPWDLPCTILVEDEISITSTTLPASERFLFFLQTYSPLHAPTAAAKELPFLDLWLLTRDLEWYFFSVLDKKFGNKARTNRATEKGYWKTTGKDRAIYHNKQIVGMKKTLVYHNGRAPSGQRSNWVMHEYRLVDVELERFGVAQDALVLCRVFQKSGSGPKNGEQYGAPFVEEEWEDDDAPKETAEVLDFGDDDFLNGHDLEQIIQTNVSSDATPLSGFHSSDGSTIEETTELRNGNQNLTVPAGKQYLQLGQPHDNMITPYNMEDKPSKLESGESSNSGSFEDLNFLLDEPFLDAFANLEEVIETNDILNPVQTNASASDMLDEYLSFVDANDNSPYLTYDSAVIAGSNGFTSDQVLLSQKEFFPGTEEAFLPSGELIYGNTNDAFNKQEFARGQSDTFVKKASKMLGTIPAPPAFAAEFPPKDAVYRLSSVARSSSSVHVNAGSRKHGNFRLILSFAFAHGDDGSACLESRVGLFPGKNESCMLRGWFFFMFMWVLILTMSFKLGAYICAN